ncbi:hypothetical protein FOMPIDRAFT_1055741 [Fomitopsis schrenkii]|uniref:Uncharacterized protein n=1 Tax=Fomitopsis schrenkii TaxID=2126942 RepID=S8DM65_FOMSC|nr:hypothetical protein FOMPIDRAFT_1055741 [Fomitopsis schrenkii]
MTLANHQRAYTLLKPALPLAAASVLLNVARSHLHTGSHTPALSVMREALAATPDGADALRLKNSKLPNSVRSVPESVRRGAARMQCWKVSHCGGEEAGGPRGFMVVLADHPGSSEALLMRALVLEGLTFDAGNAEAKAASVP